jgi:hypothetical protein
VEILRLGEFLPDQLRADDLAISLDQTAVGLVRKEQSISQMPGKGAITPPTP